MAATPEPPDAGVPILTYVAARFSDLDRSLDERFGRIDDNHRHLEETSSREHKLVRADLAKLAGAVERLSERDLRRAGALEVGNQLLVKTGVAVSLALGLVSLF